MSEKSEIGSEKDKEQREKEREIDKEKREHDREIDREKRAADREIEKERLDFEFKYWLECERVAMHFNDLIARFRIQALGGLAVVSGIVSVIARSADPMPVEMLGYGFLGLLLFWVALFLLDNIYYGNLLEGAVRELLRLEEASAGRISLSRNIDEALRDSRPGWLRKPSGRMKALVATADLRVKSGATTNEFLDRLLDSHAAAKPGGVPLLLSLEAAKRGGDVLLFSAKSPKRWLTWKIRTFGGHYDYRADRGRLWFYLLPAAALLAASWKCLDAPEPTPHAKRHVCVSCELVANPDAASSTTGETGGGTGGP